MNECNKKNEEIFIKTGLNMHFPDGEIISLAELNCPSEKIQKKLEKIINTEEKKGGKNQKGGTRWTMRCHAKIMALIAMVLIAFSLGMLVNQNPRRNYPEPDFCSLPVLPDPPSILQNIDWGSDMEFQSMPCSDNVANRLNYLIIYVVLGILGITSAFLTQGWYFDSRMYRSLYLLVCGERPISDAPLDAVAYLPQIPIAVPEEGDNEGLPHANEPDIVQPDNAFHAVANGNRMDPPVLFYIDENTITYIQ